ncbi:hypothetical protein, unlikely [Trypanosoma brucei gambiense DAL972]|uniref:Uncharacterized protein n=1 Tax=Trypanosoma brucei gambiense (strain MHOM/CI/86/DAL972) TaxID=679716 RepID=D0A2N7_TRYB9|nr:hypothetical protein, unlikely [Trypanosoma brucei gambiense DAL972]CBH15531.1 hypothetical protein, unlikely [Trypanosoma brucei gambiense DAL972]|eukprot:XP_011777795.1 hypothetical protein, unlikely [Trypanosoma brucei gambiense DAL972]
MRKQYGKRWRKAEREVRTATGEEKKNKVESFLVLLFLCCFFFFSFFIVLLSLLLLLLLPLNSLYNEVLIAANMVATLCLLPLPLLPFTSSLPLLPFSFFLSFFLFPSLYAHKHAPSLFHYLLPNLHTLMGGETHTHTHTHRPRHAKSSIK